MSSPPIKTAIITGASSGIGLALTQHLLALSSPAWRVVLADVNPPPTSLSPPLDPHRTIYYRTDVSLWSDQAALFKMASSWPLRNETKGHGQIDFFAANAGIGDREHACAHFDLDAEPQPPNLKCLEVNLHAVFYGLKLFIHYARKTRATFSPAPGKASFNPNMVITASLASLYPFQFAPQYGASKHALLGLTRAVGPKLLAEDNIAVNCIMPAFVVTNLAPDSVIAKCPEEHLTPMSTIIRAFDELNGDSKERKTGQAVECVEKELYYRDPIEYVCEGSRWLGRQDRSGGLWDMENAHGMKVDA